MHVFTCQGSLPTKSSAPFSGFAYCLCQKSFPKPCLSVFTWQCLTAVTSFEGGVRAKKSKGSRYLCPGCCSNGSPQSSSTCLPASQCCQANAGKASWILLGSTGKKNQRRTMLHSSNGYYSSKYDDHRSISSDHP